ncbi:Leucine zipper transcription factor-like protein 1, partial [Toxocara canis]
SKIQRVEMSGELGLSDHHENNLVQYLKFCRLQRQSRIATVQALFNDTIKKKLIDETYTKEEVIKVLSELREVTAGELESELINIAHMNLLLFRQLSAQAEKFNINLFINLSELEDRELLDAVQIFEKEHFEKRTAKTATILRKLVALEGTVEERAERRNSEEKTRMLEELNIREKEMADLRRKSEADRVREQQLLNELESVEHRLLQTKEQV